MRASGLPVPKPLAPVLGVTLLERNVCALLRDGFTDLTVAVEAGSEGNQIARFVDERIEPICRSASAKLRVFVEPMPLGNVGCAGLVARGEETVLLVFSDNLTTLDLADLADAHMFRDAAMTLAAHHQPHQLAYGQLTMAEGLVIAYEEKPQQLILISSGIAVLGPTARSLIPADRPTGLVTLFHLVRDAGLSVAGYVHDDPWIDVNDAQSVACAEDLITQHAQRFASWNPPSQ
jgi:NDP-sugar pyrophosphorylase family protein